MNIANIKHIVRYVEEDPNNRWDGTKGNYRAICEGALIYDCVIPFDGQYHTVEEQVFYIGSIKYESLYVDDVKHLELREGEINYKRVIKETLAPIDRPVAVTVTRCKQCLQPSTHAETQFSLGYCYTCYERQI